MLQNAYLVAKIGADTAENERNVAEICQKLATTLRPGGGEAGLPAPLPERVRRVAGRPRGRGGASVRG